jgi:hypothetical protein
MGKQDLERCIAATKKMKRSLYAFPFHQLPDRDSEAMRDYFQNVARPIDLATVLANLEQNAYGQIQEWVEDMNLIWENAINYNGADSMIGAAAIAMKEKFARVLEWLPLNAEEKWLAKLGRVLQEYTEAGKTEPE